MNQIDLTNINIGGANLIQTIPMGAVTKIGVEKAFSILDRYYMKMRYSTLQNHESIFPVLYF